MATPGTKESARHNRRLARPLAAIAATALAAGTCMVVGAASAGAAAALRPARVGQAPVPVAGTRLLGALAPSSVLHVDIALKPRDPAALARFAAGVSTPGSSEYHHYLRRGAFARVFGPTRAAIRAVEADLSAHGLTYGRLSSNHLILPVRASAAAVGRAFSIGFDRVRLPSGRLAYYNTIAPRLSGAAARAVQAVIGLDDLNLPHHLSLVRVPVHRAMKVTPHVVTGGPQPCSAAVSAGPSNDAYTADQLASAYRFSSLYGAGDEGAGVTVALFELEPNLTTDISAYQSCYGTSATVTYVKEDGGAGSGAGQGEAALDIEDIIGLAPKSTINVYQAPNSNTGLTDDYTAIVDNDTAKVISTSWGECESSEGSSAAASENTLFQQAATQGQSMFAAAGDSGSEDCGTNALAVDDPASQPYVTGVGGTQITALGPSPTENVWNEKANGAGAGGGGVSTLWTMPSYQTGAPSSLNVINGHSSGTQCKAASGSYCREVPDVTADADPYSGYVVYYNGAWTGIGGTSAAAPLWAAFTALTDASSSCAGKAVGFANPVLYKAAAAGYSSDFQDITSGNNDYTGTNSGLYPAGTGYDMASGLGSPDGANLPAALCSGGATGNTVTVTNPGSQTSTVGTAVSLQIHASDSASGQTLTYSATGLPAGLSISSSSGLVSGTPTTAGTSSTVVTAKDTTGASGSASFSWTVSSTTGNTVTVTNPGSQTSTVGTAVSLQIHASDSASGQTLTYSATGLPAGLSISSSSGLVSGTPTTAGTSSTVVTAKDTTGASGSASFSWTVKAVSSCTAKQLLGNPGFETGSASPWTATSGVIESNSEAGGYEVAHSGSWFAWLDGYGTAHTDTLAQTVTVPTGCTNYAFSFWKHIDTFEGTSTVAADTLKVQVLNSSGTVVATLATYSNLNAANGYQQVSFSLKPYAGEKITLKFTGKETDSYGGTTDFCVDDTAFNVS